MWAPTASTPRTRSLSARGRIRRAAGFEARARHFPEIQLFQLFIADPDGLMIELNFPGLAAAPRTSP
jgi:hypothetical protein